LSCSIVQHWPFNADVMLVESLVTSPHAGRGPLTDADESKLRFRARARAERLAVEIQDGADITAAEIADFVSEADQHGWPDVARACLLLEVMRSEREPKEVHIAAIERLLDRATRDGDAATVALALARRSEVQTTSGDPAQFVAADGDLARATVLLEGATGSSRMRARAHVNCGIVYGQRHLWELEDEHYLAAEAALHGEPLADVGLVILYNRAEVQLEWACALRELGKTEEARQRVDVAIEALRAADVEPMPDSWALELRIFARLLDAIAPGAGVPNPGELVAEGHNAGMLHLAKALTATDCAHARSEAGMALALIDPAKSRHIHNLALGVAAEIEAEIAGAETAGLRYARHLAHLRWEARLSRLASMQSLLQVERLRSEHDLLTQHAYLDDLTRLGNRRALYRHVDGLVGRGVQSVAVVVIDIDHFKTVNDTYGHAAGDEALARLGSLLRSAVRAQDLAVRIGGDEFILVLPATKPSASRRRAQAIVEAVEAAPWEEISSGLRVTASAGLACGDPHQLTTIILAADEALYRSKAAGGNVVTEG
jgi:diguanylate cyclase (GGDEF)-like protein